MGSTNNNYNIEGLNEKLEAEKALLKLKDDKKLEGRFATLENRFDLIKKVIAKEELPPESRDILLNKLLTLSPKRTGLFLEVFNKKQNNLQPSTNQFHDAVLRNNNKVEIKASRVLITEKLDLKAPTNLYDQLMSENRVYSPFSKMLVGDYDCNIQQIKTTEFDQLNYCLFFQDVILEFSIHKDTIKNTTVDEKLSLLRDKIRGLNLSNEAELMKTLEFKKTPTPRDIISLKELAINNPGLIDFFEKIDIIFQIYNKGKLGYSDKQHKGNEGEGQFHINKDNVIYHLVNNFVGAYSYADFVSVLKGKLINDKKQTKPKL
ncbi:hypothetical protein [Burkholderia multivorans]|uniref:hypothetical protein n=1 Tax=Burkholderia multivorans TaxID=87883 RepID=UPI0011B22113|nr:hypothetical protein [Burkholderia multivorans]